MVTPPVHGDDHPHGPWLRVHCGQPLDGRLKYGEHTEYDYMALCINKNTENTIATRGCHHNDAIFIDGTSSGSTSCVHATHRLNHGREHSEKLGDYTCQNSVVFLHLRRKVTAQTSGCPRQSDHFPARCRSDDGTIERMNWRKYMPKFDWSKEPPKWKLAAWAIMFLPTTLLAAAVVLKALK